MQCKSVTYFQWWREPGNGVASPLLWIPLPSTLVTPSPWCLARRARGGEVQPHLHSREAGLGRSHLACRRAEVLPQIHFQSLRPPRRPSWERALPLFLSLLCHYRCPFNKEPF